MKSLFFILLAGYTVRSYENNYYVIQMSDDPPMQTKKPFKVYWNVPTMQCSSKKIFFENLYEDYGIIQNDNDRFKGEKVTILYDPGLFPALFKNETSGKFRFRNGGVPQEGDLGKHLDAFEKDLGHSIPDKDFGGVGIIDFESWRPVFRQNFGVLQPYKDVSIEIERKLHWWWKKAWIEDEAKRRFEEAARTYMQSTLSVAKRLRPRAQWGFYGFPYCFNMASNNMVERCAKSVPEENDQTPWLWSGSTALYPSVYSSVQLSTSQLESLVRGRIREAARCARAARSNPDILPYFWFRYRDAGFLSEADLTTALSTLYKSNASGILIWGSSNDVNTVDKCKKLLRYVKTTLGPAIAKYTKQTNKYNLMYTIDNATYVSRIDTTTEIPIYNDDTNSDTNIDLDPEFHWDPPENYSQQIKHKVEEEINKKISQEAIRTGNDKNRFPVLLNNSVLIDMILNTILSDVENVNYTSTETPKTKNDKKTQQEEDLLSTTEVSPLSNTISSQIINSVVTNNPLRSENNDNIDSQDELKVIGPENVDILISDETTTTEKIIEQTVTTDIISSYPPIEIEFDTLSVSDITTADTVDTTNMTENEYIAILDTEISNFFNINTFNNHNSVTNSTTNAPIQAKAKLNDYETNLTKNDKKLLLASTVSFTDQNLETGVSDETTNNIEFEDLSTVSTFIDSTTKSVTDDFKTTVTNEKIFNTTNSEDTTKYMEQTETTANETESSTFKTIFQNNEDYIIESSSNANELAKTDYLDSNDSLKTTPDFNDLKFLEEAKSINGTDVTKLMDSATTENVSKTTVTEESSTPTESTTTKQVAV